MDPETQARLLALNRAFYDAVADPFDATRQATAPGMVELVKRLPTGDTTRPLTVADIGCGNGRLARLLAARGTPVAYVGVDDNAALLAHAQAQTAALPGLTARFVQADLAQPGWETQAPRPSAGGFDVVTCLATLHHLPGTDLRLATVAALTRLLSPGGVLALSLWQFFDSPRLVAKQVAWAACDIDPAAVEPGDALLPWQQGTYAVRYVHQIDAGELARLAAATGLVIDATFRADGKEGNLNLYALLRRGERSEMER